jgi:large subunit ribosomal protein L21
MYAVIKAGGKQHRVKPGDVIEVELMHGQHGTSVTFTPLLVVDDEGKTHVGKDLGKAQVKARLLGEQKGKKVKVFKYRPKTGYAKSQGHRQLQSLVEIEDVVLGRRAASKKASDDSTKAHEPELEAAAGPSEVEGSEEPS